MIDPELRDLWTPAGLLLGFQITFFKWRIEREAKIGDKGDIPWLIPSDYVSILGMCSIVIGTILLPLLGVVSLNVARTSFGFGALLFVSQALGIAGHYQLYNRTKPRKLVWFPVQEKVVLTLTALISALYFIALTAESRLP